MSDSEELPTLKDVDGVLSLMSLMGNEDKCHALLKSVQKALQMNEKVCADANRRLAKIVDIGKQLEELAKREKAADEAIQKMADMRAAFESYEHDVALETS